MSKEDSIEVTGTVLEKFPSGLFSVQLEHERVVLAHVANANMLAKAVAAAGVRVPLSITGLLRIRGLALRLRRMRFLCSACVLRLRAAVRCITLQC